MERYQDTYDLHVHSSASDGMLTPGEVLARASELGLGGIAITDHDTVMGIDEALQYLARNGCTAAFVPGIEMNTEVEEVEVHILGYFINHRHQPLLDRLEEIKQARLERAGKMIARLRNMGLTIHFGQVEKLARGDLIGRPHIAQALMLKGYVFSIKEAFEKYIGKGRPAYVPRYRFLPQEAIQLIVAAGGIPVLAHPGLIKDQQLIRKMIDYGVRGIEAYYPEHTAEQVNHYLHISQMHDLLITGGSDFHGIDSDHSRSRLGCAGVDRSGFERLLSAHRQGR